MKCCGMFLVAFGLFPWAALAADAPAPKKPIAVKRVVHPGFEDCHPGEKG